MLAAILILGKNFKYYAAVSYYQLWTFGAAVWSVGTWQLGKGVCAEAQIEWGTAKDFGAWSAANTVVVELVRWVPVSG